MVLDKREECVLNAFSAAEFPLESKPIRKKRSNLRKCIEARRVDPMDLLATVAEMMLLQREKKAENLLTSSVSKDFCKKIDKPLDKGKKTVKVEQCYQENYNEGILVGNSHGQTSSGDSVISGSSVAKSDVAGKRRPGKAEVKNMMPSSIKVENSSIGKTGASSIMGDPMELERNQSSSFSSGSSVGTGTSSCRDPAPPCVRSSPLSKEDAKLKDQHGGDDDENSSGCTHSGPIRPEPSSTEQAGERRNGIAMDSKIRKIARAVTKDEEFLIRDVDVRFRSRKVCCKRQRTQRSSFRRKKLHERNNQMPSAAAKAGENAVKVEGSSTPAAPHGGVKIRIKSFRIPELFIDMPENATVGSLKRTVLETVTAMLGDRLEVGLILQGRKVRDDSRTLVQTGIACREKLDSLSFSLEPTPLPLCPELPTFESPRPLATLPALPAPDSAAISSKPDTNESSPVRLDDGCNDSPANSTPKFKALVPLSPGASESMALVPQSGKPKRTEVAQRRIRRPFSVTEVEALVKAVESLGTGRWRDVKLLAFDEAKHRTYVDLKDKWKTLVHTAQISPQQRRGEPVPQMLLDRVLRTHAYWTRHGQSKPPPVSSTPHHHPKQEQSTLQLMYQRMTTEDSTLPPSSP